MITSDPYGIRYPVKPGKLPERPFHAETIATNDTPEDIERCLHCKRTRCSGNCGSNQKLNERRHVIYRLAEIMYNGGTNRFAMECLGLTDKQIRRYEKTAEYEQKMERLRRNRRGNTSADE